MKASYATSLTDCATPSQVLQAICLIAGSSGTIHMMNVSTAHPGILQQNDVGLQELCHHLSKQANVHSVATSMSPQVPHAWVWLELQESKIGQAILSGL